MKRILSSLSTFTRRLAVLALLAAVAIPALANDSNKWRIQMDGAANVAGEIEFSFTPKDGTATSVVVAIPDGTHENNAARLVMNAIKAKFGKKIYKTEIDDGEDVLVKAKGSTPHFALIVVRNTAEGLKVTLDRE